jgi:S-adenosylmethionine hydrolase
MSIAFRGRSVVAGVLILAAALASQPAAAQTAENGGKRPIIVFMTDFGTTDDAVPICKGVMLGIAPEARIVDLTHQVTPFSIADGARFLYGATPYYPAGSVFVVVIDPTVGSSRKAIIAKSKKGQYFVLPDNGLLTLVEDRDGIEAAREITNRAWMIGAGISSTFHGRDIFSPAGAHLARGDDWSQAGPELKQLVRIDVQTPKTTPEGITGQVFALDGPFGNLISNIRGEQFKQLGYKVGDEVHLKLGEREMTMRFAKTFADVPVGQPLLFIDSRGRCSIALNQRDFAKTYNIKPPLPLFLPSKK